MTNKKIQIELCQNSLFFGQGAMGVDNQIYESFFRLESDPVFSVYCGIIRLMVIEV